MEPLKKHLSCLGVDAGSLRVLRSTDAGDVLAFDAAGGEPAVALWERLRAAAADTGHWPVMLGPPDEVEDLDEQFDDADDDGATVAKVLKRAGRIKGEKVLAERAAEHAEDAGDDADGMAGEWPADGQVGPNVWFSTPFDVSTREPLETVVFALVPTADSWAVPAFLALGGWNECPAAAEMAAVLGYWQEKYDAEVVAATRSVVELRCRRPPTTREAALTLAGEQYAFCADVVDQGTETVARLAATLLNGSAWYFWWD